MMSAKAHGTQADAQTNSVKAATDKKDDSDNPKTGADIGKIVNLMSTDANRVCNFDRHHILSVADEQLHILALVRYFDFKHGVWWYV